MVSIARSLTTLVLLVLWGDSWVLGQAALARPGRLVIHDDGRLFSPEAIRQAEERFRQAPGLMDRQVTIQTLAALPASDKAALDKIPADDSRGRSRFWSDFARRSAKEEHAQGVYILLCRSPGHVHVLADSETTRRWFSERKVRELEEQLVRAMRDAAREKDSRRQVELRDQALASAVDYLEKNLGFGSSRSTEPARAAEAGGEAEGQGGAGWGWGGILCVALSILAGLWLVIALVRALSGAGMGGRGGFGGFLPSLLGGLFGAAAGMWLYDHFFGGHSSTAQAGDGGLSGSEPSTGAGDWSGGADAGGEWDAGGGGWDAGGGGDVGGDF